MLRERSRMLPHGHSAINRVAPCWSRAGCEEIRLRLALPPTVGRCARCPPRCALDVSVRRRERDS